jgi:hypothetical protein
LGIPLLAESVALFPKGVVQMMFKVLHKGVAWFQAGVDAHQVIADLAFVNIHGVAIRRATKEEMK